MFRDLEPAGFSEPEPVAVAAYFFTLKSGIFFSLPGTP
jgi:hypothetical protein